MPKRSHDPLIILYLIMYTYMYKYLYIYLIISIHSFEYITPKEQHCVVTLHLHLCSGQDRTDTSWHS